MRTTRSLVGLPWCLMLLSSSISADLRDPIDVHSSADRRAQQSPLLGQSDSQRIEQDAASIPTTSLNTTATAASSKDDPNTTSTAASSKDDPIIAAESSGVNATPTAPAEASPQLVALINTNAMGNETASVSPRSNTSLFKTNEATPVTAPSVNAVVTAPSPQAAAVTIASPAGEVVTISAPVTAPHLKPPVTVPSSQAAAVTAMAPAEVAVTNAAPVSAPPVKAVVTNPSPQTAAVPIASSAEGVATISAPVTAPSVPNDSTLKPPADKNETERMDDDVDGISRFMAPGVLVIVVVLVIGVRKMLCPSSDARGSPVHGKYQGVATGAEDDDEEWGWDDAPKQQRVEMMNMSTPKQRAKGTPFHRRSVSPGNSSGNSQGVYTASGNLVGTVPAPDFGHSMLQNSNEHKGFSVKKSGMKNPLHSHQPLQPQKHSAVLPKNPHQPQTSKADDFFEEMGLATKPKFKVLASDAGPRATSSRGLGATALLMDDDDLGGEADWDDDADLDDLLND